MSDRFLVVGYGIGETEVILAYGDSEVCGAVADLYKDHTEYGTDGLEIVQLEDWTGKTPVAIYSQYAVVGNVGGVRRQLARMVRVAVDQGAKVETNISSGLTRQGTYHSVYTTGPRCAEFARSHARAVEAAKKELGIK